jgi:hypothetical protein
MSQSDSEARGSSSQRPSGSKSSAKPIARGSPVANFAEHSCPDSCDRLGVADYANACPENLTLNGSLHGDTFFLVDRLLGSPLPVGGTFFFLAGLAVAQKWRFCSADLFGAVSGCRPACSAGVLSSSLSAIDRPSPTPVRLRIGCGVRFLRTEDGPDGLRRVLVTLVSFKTRSIKSRVDSLFLRRAAVS